MTDPAAHEARRLAASLRRYAQVGSSLDLPTPKRAALEAADALDDLAASRAQLEQMREKAERVLEHGKAAYAAGWQGDVSTGYFEDEEAGKLAYSLAQDVAAALAAISDPEEPR